MAYYESASEGIELERALDIENESWLTARLMGECFDTDELDINDADNTDGTRESTLPESAGEGSFCKEAEEPCSIQLLSLSADEGEMSDGGFSELFDEMDECERELLCLLAMGERRAAQRYAIDSGRLFGEMCERINSLALDKISDILIECDSEGYFILPDYESEVKEWLKI